MKLLICAIFAIFITVNAHDTCPAFNDWMQQSGCLWIYPLQEMRQNITNACELNFNISSMPAPPPLPPEIANNMPGRCGYCSSKFQCRKRQYEEGKSCFPIDIKQETCSQFSDVCTMPKTMPPFNNCKWGLLMEMLKQCILRPDIDEWKREAIRNMTKLAPEANCIESGGQCKCCCHPYRPSKDGTRCVEMKAPDCSDFSPWNDWSECLWFPLKDVASKFQQHCSIDYKAKDVEPKVPLPEGFQIPDKCGYCSFRVRCRKRPREDTSGKKRCFPIEADKKSCGPEDCTTCGDVCTLPKLAGNCNWGKHIRTALKGKLSKIDKFPYWRRRGMMNVVKYLPIGQCVEKDGKCKCCCHPYEPNEDGTSCVLKGYCNMPEDLGINPWADAARFRRYFKK